MIWDFKQHFPLPLEVVKWLGRGWKPVYQPHFWTAVTGRIQKVYHDAQKRLVLIAHSLTHTHTHTHTHTPPRSHTVVCSPPHTHTSPLSHCCMHTHTHTHLPALTAVCTHTHTHTHTLSRLSLLYAEAQRASSPPSAGKAGLGAKRVGAPATPWDGTGWPWYGHSGERRAQWCDWWVLRRATCLKYVQNAA